jgi:site-specific recombinase XerD
MTGSNGREIMMLDPDEVLSLMDACSNPRRRRQCPTGVRNRALIAVLYRTGLRCAEALTLTPEDLSEAHGTVLVRNGKGGKRRVAGMDEGGFKEVAEWIAIRPESRYLFCTLDGGKLDAGYVRAMFYRKRDKAKIKRRVHPHGLRHTHAGELALEQIPIPLIQRQLGHSRLETTSVYLQALAPEATISAIRQRKWSR